jgi:hypothetical protein
MSAPKELRSWQLSALQKRVTDARSAPWTWTQVAASPLAPALAVGTLTLLVLLTVQPPIVCTSGNNSLETPQVDGMRLLAATTLASALAFAAAVGAAWYC